MIRVTTVQSRTPFCVIALAPRNDTGEDAQDADGTSRRRPEK